MSNPTDTSTQHAQATIVKAERNGMVNLSITSKHDKGAVVIAGDA
jgi:hypothetical protein